MATTVDQKSEQIFKSDKGLPDIDIKDGNILISRDDEDRVIGLYVRVNHEWVKFDRMNIETENIDYLLIEMNENVIVETW